MATSDATLNAAIHVYTLTIAYLQDAQIGNDGLINAMKAEEVTPNYFYIWHLETSHESRWFDTLAAACTYNEAAQVWTVQLISGETMRLQDKGDLWELVKSELSKRKSDLCEAN